MELREDPWTGDRVVVAPERARRPLEAPRPASLAEAPHHDSDCPLCPGNEARTPPEVDRIPARATEAWGVRVVPNAFPIMWPGLGGTGAAHEIIVETPDHAATLADLEDDAVADVFAMYARRWRALHARPDVEAVVLYRNEGSEAGASLRHAHAQAVALPTLPPRWVRTRAFARSRLRAASASVAADVLAEERAVGSRVLLDTDEFVAYHPFASLWPFEACIQPDVGVAPFGRLGDAERRALAILTRDVLRALRRVLGPFPYNLLLEAPAADLEREGLLRWRVRILPRLAHLAGFELATGMHVNTVPPEEACERVRRVLGR